jgi:hypothetical protein
MCTEAEKKTEEKEMPDQGLIQYNPQNSKSNAQYTA